MAAPPRRPELLRCDFCGAEVRVVKRVALDAGYDRLKPHREQYACEPCSERKERERLSAEGR